MPLDAPGKVVENPPNPSISRASVNLGESGATPSTDYDIFSCIARDDVFSTQDGPLVVGDIFGPPIVGRMAGAGTMLGLRDKLDREFNDVPRGAIAYSILGGEYYVWETSKYYAKPKSLLQRRPRVCVISANRYQIPSVLGDTSGLKLVDYITSRYSELDGLGLQVILDTTRNNHYNPYLMGVPMRAHNPPFGGTDPPSFDAHELLTLHYWPAEFPTGATPGSGGTGGFTIITDTSSGVRGYSEAYGSYFHYKAATTGFGPPTPAYYNEFRSPKDDIAIWMSCFNQYRRRRHIVHPQTYYDSPLPFFATVAAPSTATPGPNPYPWGVYYQNLSDANIKNGREFTTDAYTSCLRAATSPSVCAALIGQTTIRDLGDSIFEDIHDFFS